MVLQKTLPGEIVSVLGSYIKGQFLIWLITTALYLLGFGIIQAPAWVFIALLLPLLDWIPHLGPVLGLAVALGISALGGADFNHILLAAGIWLAVETITSYVLQPRILGHRLGLSPLTVFIVTIVGGILFPPFGFVLAVPVAAVAALIWRRITTGSPIPRR